VPDTTPPTVVHALVPTSQVLRVRFSEPMRQDGDRRSARHAYNYCVELKDATPDECNPSDAFTLGRDITAADGSTFDIALPFPPGGGEYKVFVSDAEDLAGNALGSPRSAEFRVGGSLRMVGARAEGVDQVIVTFSREVEPGVDAAGGAGCGTAARCATRYRLLGPSSSVEVRSAQVRPAPFGNEVLLTLSAPLGGGAYTVIAANGVDGDGLDDAAASAIKARGRGRLQDLALGAQPLDRASFGGPGPSLLSSEGGLHAAWSQRVVFNGRVYLGRNTEAGPLLWRCDLATEADCDAAGWKRVAASGEPDDRLSLLVVSGGSLYVGYDNPVSGVRVYRASVPVPSSGADFTGEGGCRADAPGCEGLGGNGFGEPWLNTRLLGAVPVGPEGREGLYFSVASEAGGPARLYRQED
jgi:hypothetical protein